MNDYIVKDTQFFLEEASRQNKFLSIGESEFKLTKEVKIKEQRSRYWCTIVCLIIHPLKDI